jgi:hypothetical protein
MDWSGQLQEEQVRPGSGNVAVTGRCSARVSRDTSQKHIYTNVHRVRRHIDVGEVSGAAAQSMSSATHRHSSCSSCTDSGAARRARLEPQIEFFCAQVAPKLRTVLHGCAHTSLSQLNHSEALAE